MSTLLQALEVFVRIYHARLDLLAEQQDWNCQLVLQAQDSDAAVGLRIASGRVQAIGLPEQNADLVVHADLALLLDILEFRRDPNEAYLFGELTVQGAESQFLRLDYVVTRLCL